MSDQLEVLRRELTAEMDRRFDRVDRRLDHLHDQMERKDQRVNDRFFSLNHTIVWAELAVVVASLAALVLLLSQS